ncbi:MAG: prepilin-type N-terminal cleavage/methylation domain-containing protein [Limisphaerales bacterium]|jgi:prepilin-type N-terminal cleavage/methylation domain-containing protein
MLEEMNNPEIRAQAPQRRCRGAFTLLEVMISIFIFALILTSIYEIWSLVLMGKQSASFAAEETQRTRVGMRALSESLMSARMFRANTNYYSFEVDNDGDYSALSFVAYLPPGFIGSGLYDGLPLRRLTYVVEANESGRNSLILYQHPLLIDEEYTDLIPPIELSTDISFFAVEFWDTNELDWVLDWENTNTLPQLARVSMGHGYVGNEPAQLDSRVVAMSGTIIDPQIQGTVSSGMTMGAQGGGQGGPGGQGGQGGGQGGQGGRPGMGGGGRPGGGQGAQGGGWGSGGGGGGGRPGGGFGPGSGQGGRPGGGFNPGGGGPPMPGGPGGGRR